VAAACGAVPPVGPGVPPPGRRPVGRVAAVVGVGGCAVVGGDVAVGAAARGALTFTAGFG
jgi:hypothetical protein